MPESSEIQNFITRFMQSDEDRIINREAMVIDTFGDSPEMADELLGLVLAGTKTATCTSLWAWETEQDTPLVPGTLAVMVDGSGRPRCVIETIRIEQVAYQDVTAEFARAEGEHDPPDLPDDEVLAHWRKYHWAFYLRTLPPLGFTPTPEMPVLCEHFRVIYAEASTD